VREKEGRELKGSGHPQIFYLDRRLCIGERLGEFNGTSSQSHISHCRVLPLGEFTVMIPEPHATLQGAVTW